jgi:hypothetical protein
MWRIDPLLSGDFVKNDRFWATARWTFPWQSSYCWKRGIFHAVGKHASITIKRQFSAWAMLRSYLEDNRGEPVSWEFSSVREAVKKRVSCKNVAVKRRLCVWYLEWVTEWDCYSFCVKISCQETASGDRNRLRAVVCVRQWSVKCNMSHEYTSEQ